MKKLLPLLLILLSSTMVMAYQVTIYGYVKKADGTPVSNHAVNIQIQVANAITHTQTAITQANGKFLVQFDFDSNVLEANAVLTTLNCNGDELMKTLHVSKTHPIADTHFVYCEADCNLKVNILKATNNNGSLVLKAETHNGSAPYSYEWSNGGHSQTIEAEKDGTYCVTVTDKEGCTGKACIVVGENYKDCAVEIQMIPLDNAGKSFKLIAHTKGDGPFTFLWTNGSTDTSIVVEKSGTYCVTIASSNGCKSKACMVVHIKEQSECAGEITVTYENGKAKLTAHAKGTAPFKYSWTNGSSDQTILVEKSGEYCVNITDANGCEAKVCAKVSLNNTHDCGVKIQIQPSNSPGSPIKLLAVAQGKGSFKYKWSTGSTDASITVEKPGEYCVVITDEAGCEAKACITIPHVGPKPCAVEIVKQPSNSGALHLKAIPKGVGPFKYSWSNGETTQTIVVEKPGEYCVKIVDANGCEASACIVIKESNHDPKGCSVHIKIKYNKGDEAYVLKAVSKEVAPFTYKWSTGEGSESIVVKEPGLYCVSITDHNGCHSVSCLEIEDDNEFTGNEEKEAQFKILKTYPVPTFHELNYHIELKEESSLTFRIINPYGAIANQFWFAQLPEGEHIIQLPIEAMSPGIYYVEIQSANTRVMSKMIKAN